MKALLPRSMLENKTTLTRLSRRLFLSVFARATLTLLLLIGGTSAVAMAQSTAIQPCTDASAAAKKPTVTAPNAVVTQTAVDESLADDPALEKLIAPYSAKVRALENVIGKLDGELRKSSVGGGSLGNFVTDGLRATSSRKLGRFVPLMITNSGGLRKNAISPGELRAADIFELLPFENALIQMDLSGQNLLKLLSVVLKGRDAQSGARIRYRMTDTNEPEIVSAKLLSADGTESDIDPKATYRIVTIDYLLHLASGSYAILQEGKNVAPMGLTMRDAMMDYVKSETAAGRSIKPALDSRFVLEGQQPTTPKVQP